MHQILGLRPYFDERKGRWDKTDNTFFSKRWRVPSLLELFSKLATYIDSIPEADRFDLFYTVAVCTEKKREFKEQHVIIFDIDGLGEKATLPPKQLVDEYAPVVFEALGVDPKKTAVVFSGNGLHFIIQLSSPIAEAGYFDANRLHYNAACTRLGAALERQGLPGKPDTKVFDARRIMRLPGTENRKEGREPRMAVLVRSALEPQDFSLVAAAGLPAVAAAEQLSPLVMKRFPKPDTAAVLAGCDFLKWAKEKPNEVSEAEWYAMLSIVPKLTDGRKLAHDFSSGHRSYSPGETDAKIDQALAASGPRTCDNINGLWGKCGTCPNRAKVQSPIMIQGATYIKTRDTGFHTGTLDDKGNFKAGKPQYEDLRRFYEEQQPYIVLGGSRTVYTYTGTHWVQTSDAELKAFAQAHFNPPADNKMRDEFVGIMACTNLRPPEWFVSTTLRKLNCQNGVLDFDTLELEPHSREFGFRYITPWSYDPKATSPQFEKFMQDIMCGRQELIDVALEYAGYAFSNDRCWAQKALLLSGVGANGKSTFIELLKALAGNENYSSLTLSDLHSITHRQLMDGKLFNLAEETPSRAMAESAVFKNLVGGGDITMRSLYKQAYTIANKTKLMFACNALPQTTDTTEGYFRRLTILPFDRRFTDADKDPFILDKLLEELPGIFNLVAHAYKKLRKQKAFTRSSIIDGELSSYRLDIDTVRAWFDACVSGLLLPPDSDVVTPLPVLYASYRNYAQAHGEDPLPSAWMSRKLNEFLPDCKERHGRQTFKGVKETVFRGVRVSDGANF